MYIYTYLYIYIEVFVGVRAIVDHCQNRQFYGQPLILEVVAAFTQDARVSPIANNSETQCQKRSQMD